MAVTTTELPSLPNGAADVSRIDPWAPAKPIDLDPQTGLLPGRLWRVCMIHEFFTDEQVNDFVDRERRAMAWDLSQMGVAASQHDLRHRVRNAKGLYAAGDRVIETWWAGARYKDGRQRFTLLGGYAPKGYQYTRPVDHMYKHPHYREPAPRLALIRRHSLAEDVELFDGYEVQGLDPRDGHWVARSTGEVQIRNGLDPRLVITEL